MVTIITGLIQWWACQISFRLAIKEKSEHEFNGKLIWGVLWRQICLTIKFLLLLFVMVSDYRIMSLDLSSMMRALLIWGLENQTLSCINSSSYKDIQRISNFSLWKNVERNTSSRAAFYRTSLQSMDVFLWKLEKSLYSNRNKVTV